MPQPLLGPEFFQRRQLASDVVATRDAGGDLFTAHGLDQYPLVDPHPDQAAAAAAAFTWARTWLVLPAFTLKWVDAPESMWGGVTFKPTKVVTLNCAREPFGVWHIALHEAWHLAHCEHPGFEREEDEADAFANTVSELHVCRVVVSGARCPECFRFAKGWDV
jgi:hypothetical protein